jgi:hypothetical protein
MTTNIVYIQKDIMNEEFGYDISGKSNATYDDIVVADAVGGVASHKSVKITFNVVDIKHHIKNNIGEFPRPISKNNRSTNQDTVYVFDSKRVSETFIIRIYLTDDETNTISAWDKYFMLRQMCVNGGPLTNFHYRGVDCDGATIVGSRVNRQAFLTEVTTPESQTERPTSGYLDDDTAAFEVALTIALGYERS